MSVLSLENYSYLADIAGQSIELDLVNKALSIYQPPNNQSFQFSELTDQKDEILSLSHQQIASLFKIDVDNQTTQNNSVVVETITINSNSITNTVAKGRIKILYELRKVLADLFNNQIDPSNGRNLKSYERKLLRFILLKKTKKNPGTTSLKKIDFESNGFLEMLRKNLHSDVCLDKRKDEMIKLIFKQSLKALKTLFFYETGFEGEEGEVEFLKYYFKGEKEKTGLDYTAFADPLNRRIRNPHFKGITAKYLNLIFKAEKFRSDFFDYINMFLLEEYKRKVFGKFSKFLKELRLRIKKMDVKREEEIVETYIKGDGFGKGKSLKFPWTEFEVKNAVDVFKTHVASILVKKDK